MTSRQWCAKVTFCKVLNAKYVLQTMLYNLFIVDGTIFICASESSLALIHGRCLCHGVLKTDLTYNRAVGVGWGGGGGGEGGCTRSTIVILFPRPPSLFVCWVFFSKPQLRTAHSPSFHAPVKYPPPHPPS